MGEKTGTKVICSSRARLLLIQDVGLYLLNLFKPAAKANLFEKPRKPSFGRAELVAQECSLRPPKLIWSNPMPDGSQNATTFRRDISPSVIFFTQIWTKTYRDIDERYGTRT
jgi:hypothetical protein